jgi:hypothetical protein
MLTASSGCGAQFACLTKRIPSRVLTVPINALGGLAFVPREAREGGHPGGVFLSGKLLWPPSSLRGNTDNAPALPGLELALDFTVSEHIPDAPMQALDGLEKVVNSRGLAGQFVGCRPRRDCFGEVPDRCAGLATGVTVIGYALCLS